MASNYTENYGLCQWEATDQVLREEFNQDNVKVDSLLKGTADLAQEAQALAQVAYTPENPPFVIGSYQGTDTYGVNKPVIFNVGFPLRCLILVPHDNTFGSAEISYILMRGMKQFRVANSQFAIDNPNTLTWTETGLEMRSTFSADFLQNNARYTYYYIAFR